MKKKEGKDSVIKGRFPLGTVKHWSESVRDIHAKHRKLHNGDVFQCPRTSFYFAMFVYLSCAVTVYKPTCPQYTHVIVE